MHSYPFFGIYLPFLLGNNTQPGESCRWFVLQCSGTCKGVTSNPILPQQLLLPTLNPPEFPLHTPWFDHCHLFCFVFFVTVRASNSYCEILANQSTMEHGNNLEPELEITRRIPHRHKKKKYSDDESFTLIKRSCAHNELSLTKVWVPRGFLWHCLLWRAQASSATEAFSSLYPTDCSDPQELPAFCPVVISQPPTSILASSSSSTQLKPTLSFPGFYWQGCFSILGIFPFLLLFHWRKPASGYHKTNRYGCPKTPQLSEAWQEPLRGAAGGQKHW